MVCDARTSVGWWCRLVVVGLMFSRTLALPPPPPHISSLEPGGGGADDDLGVFLRQTRKHARPMFYINCGYRDLCYCYSKMTRHHYCCSCEVGACFPAHARVATPAGTHTPMAHLRTGDQVLAVSEDGAVVTTRVLGFMDRRPRESALYLTLTTSAGHNLTLSPNHVLFKTATPNSSHPVSVFGSEVSVGDVIFSANQTGLQRVEVVGIHHEVTQGAYVPLTREGTLVVEGSLVSCYASYRHSLAHKFLAPVRSFPALLHLRPGMLARLGAWAKSVAGSVFRGLLRIDDSGNVNSTSILSVKDDFGTGYDVMGVENDGFGLEGGDAEVGDEVGEEGEAYYITLVKVVGRLLYQSERAASTVLQVKAEAPKGGWGQILWLPAGVLTHLPSSLLGHLARSW